MLCKTISNLLTDSRILHTTLLRAFFLIMVKKVLLAYYYIVLDRHFEEEVVAHQINIITWICDVAFG